VATNVGIKFDFQKNCSNFVNMKFMFMTLIVLAGLMQCGQRNTKAVAEAPEAVQIEESLADGTKLSWDTMVYDFGDFSVTDGPVTCSFTFTNDGEEPIFIYEVVSSCGCTGVTFKREPVKPGESGTISATYKNEDGPGAFDKTLTVYVSGMKRPVILRLRGVVHEKKKSLSQIYTERLGDLGLKTLEYKVPGLKQGLVSSESFSVANLGKSAINVDFTDLSAQLAVKVDPNPVPAGTSAKMTFTVTADRELWGRNVYKATPVVNGRKAGKALEVVASTQENFALMSAQERDSAAMPMFTTSTYEFGTVSKGEKVKGEFQLVNRGKAPFHVYKADAESPALSVVPADVPAGGKGKLEFLLDTSSLPEGETVIMVSLTTNSPLRPVVNLFVAGIVK
jgi:hypothetical protein